MKLWVEFDETNYERNSIDLNDLISKIRMKGYLGNSENNISTTSYLCSCFF